MLNKHFLNQKKKIGKMAPPVVSAVKKRVPFSESLKRGSDLVGKLGKAAEGQAGVNKAKTAGNCVPDGDSML